MSEKYKLSIMVLTACLLTGCGVGETVATEDVASESQSVANTEAITIDTPETFSVLLNLRPRKPLLHRKKILIDFTGISEFHPEGTAAQPYSLEILSETYNNITFADEWYNASEDISLP